MYAVMVLRVQYMSKLIAAFSILIGSTIAEDYQVQPSSQLPLSKYAVKEFTDIFSDLETARK